jgi:hypothetical protein
MARAQEAGRRREALDRTLAHEGSQRPVRAQELLGIEGEAPLRRAIGGDPCDDLVPDRVRLLPLAEDVLRLHEDDAVAGGEDGTSQLPCPVQEALPGRVQLDAALRQPRDLLVAPERPRLAGHRGADALPPDDGGGLLEDGGRAAHDAQRSGLARERNGLRAGRGHLAQEPLQLEPQEVGRGVEVEELQEELRLTVGDAEGRIGLVAGVGHPVQPLGHLPGTVHDLDDRHARAVGDAGDVVNPLLQGCRGALGGLVAVAVAEGRDGFVPGLVPLLAPVTGRFPHCPQQPPPHRSGNRRHGKLQELHEERGVDGLPGELEEEREHLASRAVGGRKAKTRNGETVAAQGRVEDGVGARDAEEEEEEEGEEREDRGAAFCARRLCSSAAVASAASWTERASRRRKVASVASAPALSAASALVTAPPGVSSLAWPTAEREGAVPGTADAPRSGSEIPSVRPSCPAARAALACARSEAGSAEESWSGSSGLCTTFVPVASRREKSWRKRRGKLSRGSASSRVSMPEGMRSRRTMTR